MTDSFKIQVSYNLPSGEQYEKGDMLNVRADSAEELHHHLSNLNQNALDMIAEVGLNLRAVNAAKRGLGAQTIETQHHPQNTQGQPQGGYQQNGGGYSQPQDNGAQNGSQGWQPPQDGGQGGPPAWAQTGQQQPQGNGYQQQGGYQGQPQQDNSGIPTSPPPHVGPPPSCSHGVKKFIAKPYKSGKPGYWMGWACPAPRGDQTQHDLEFIRQS